MTRSSSCLMALVALVLGIAIGAKDDWRSLATTAHANGLDQVAAERGYNELKTGASPLQESSELLAKIARLTTNSVVHIESERPSKGRGRVEETGSGVIVESSKAKGFFVVTNRHVVDGAPLKNLSIHLHDGRVIHPSHIWNDKETDVAVMKIAAADLQPARWGDSDKVAIGHMVLAMGSPFGLSQSITYGIISAKGRRALRLGEASDVRNQDFLQTDAAINPGNSGGPLIDLQGQVIGINTAIASNSGGNEGIGFSIPSNLVRNVIEQLLEHGKVTRGYLGVKLDNSFDSESAARLKLDRVRGARILEVYPNTPAARANMQFDDVILTFDGVEVLDENHLINLVSLTAVDKKVKAVVFRGGKHVTVDVILGDWASHDRAEAPSAPGMGTRIEPLGLTVHQLDSDLAQQLGFEKSSRGLLVLKVEGDSPLGSEVRLYDLIEEVARVPVGSLDELHSAMRNMESSDSVLLTVKRSSNGKLQNHVVVLHR